MLAMFSIIGCGLPRVVALYRDYHYGLGWLFYGSLSIDSCLLVLLGLALWCHAEYVV